MRTLSLHPISRIGAALSLVALAAPLHGQNHAPAQTRTVEQAPATAPSQPQAAAPSFHGSGPSGSMSMDRQSREGSRGHQRRTTASDRPRNLPPPASQEIQRPRATPRAENLPENRFWKTRDLFAEIRTMARQGFIAVTQIPETLTTLEDFCWFPSGWRAYGFAVPTKESIKVRLHHTNEGWFRLVAVNKWGQTGAGMLQNLIPTGNPEVSFNNLADGPQVVYVIVDDPGWMSSKERPYTIDIKRSWDPAVKAVPPVPMVLGIWAQQKQTAPAHADTQEPGPKTLP
jgi:hypothetical protein